MTAIAGASRGKIDADRSPFFLVLERAGRRVLRPGGIAGSGHLLEALGIGPGDDVVELAAGVGATARRALSRRPASYLAVEPEHRFASRLTRVLQGSHATHLEARAEHTGLPDASADVVLGEAVLTMQPVGRRETIVAEAARVLRPGGRYGIHELAVRGGGGAGVQEVRDDLSHQTHVNALPLTPEEWSTLLGTAGLEVVSIRTFPVRLLSVRGIVADEGYLGALRLAGRLALWPAGRRRIRRTKAALRQHGGAIEAVVVVATKPAATPPAA